ncbi:MAG: serine protease [Pirellulales bacterium]
MMSQFRHSRRDFARSVLPTIAFLVIMVSVVASSRTPAIAQSVGLPAPRLLTTMPMGGKAGTEVEITITGERLEGAESLFFSDPRLTAKSKLTADGKPEPNKYVVTIAADCPVGVYEARVLTPLGASSARAFSVGTLNEVVRTAPNTTLAAALALPLNSVCNASISPRAVDFYTFEARKDQRIIVDCATRGIDSKLDATVVVADSLGRDLMVERRGGVIDFTAPQDGKYVVKIHELTFNGGAPYYYRLGVWELAKDAPLVRQPTTKPVNSFSWPPTGLPAAAALAESEPNNDAARAQKITLPCDLSGAFYPAADVDVFEFEAKKGEEWWIEAASERFGLPTDPAVLVQHITKTPEGEKAIDVVELTDIPSPVKVSSNGYAYDGPPYDAGSSDVLGKLVIKEDGTYRLQLTDLFGGTRTDARNVYRLVIRKAAPDFAVVGWALHMELRNGDRNALSKPLSLRNGATMALEVVALRRDGYDGEIDLQLEGLPEGVTARGLKMPPGQSRGTLLVTAAPNAPRSMSHAKFVAKGKIGEEVVARTGRIASVAWPIPDSWGEIPRPRLVDDIVVSASDVDFSPLSIAGPAGQVLEPGADGKIAVPLFLTRRSEFSGATMQMRAMGAGLERLPQFDITLTSDKAEAVIDVAALKLPPGEHWFAFYGGAVAKYREPKKDSTAAPPTDIVDIIVSEPIAIRVNSGAAK